MATLAPGQMDLEAATPAMHWHPATRLAFRFCVLYFTLYCLGNQILTSLLPLPNIDVPDLSARWPVRLLPIWTAVHIFHAPPPSFADTGSGDRMFDYSLTFCFLVVAVAGTFVWSALDRRRESYPLLYTWFRVALRIALGGQMFIYGMAKAIPLQMPAPYLTRLIEPYGNFSPMGVLWSFIGSSPRYETFTGCCELLGGVLLFIPRTATFGALVSLAAVTHVFMLNMTYDVPVKLLSFHLILLSLFLLAPDLRRLADFFLFDRGASPSARSPLFRSPRANRIAVTAQILFGALLLALNVYGGYTAWHQFGPAREKSPLYGIWDVDQMAIDGQVRSPLLTDYDRYRRLIFDFPTRMNFQRIDSSFGGFDAAIDMKAMTIALTKTDDKDWKGNLAIQRPAPDHMLLDGEMGGHKMHFDLRLFDRNKVLLINRGFHWIQENPFNR